MVISYTRLYNNKPTTLLYITAIFKLHVNYTLHYDKDGEEIFVKLQFNRQFFMRFLKSLMTLVCKRIDVTPTEGDVWGCFTILGVLE